MNHIQFLLFIVYIGAILISGLGIYIFVNPKNENYLNRGVLLGEILLLGSIFIIGQMMILSLLKMYCAPYLWGIVLLNYLFFSNREVRKMFKGEVLRNIRWDIPSLCFVGLLAIFVFRNCYFLVDVDSHSTYLFAQKLWLENKTSIFGSVAQDVRIFVPHFNAVPYSLGLCLFPKETLFPQLIVAFWSLLVFILIFGYTSYRFNRYYGLAATMLVMFNDHIFYSGANKYVIINSALIALLFSVVYNFFESRKENSSFRFFLALLFLGQLMANKYQMFYVLVFMLIIGFVIQDKLRNKICNIFNDKKRRIVFFVSVIFMFLWFLKNYFATGLATFPILADVFKIFNWTPEMTEVFNKAFVSPLSFMKIIKYISFLFVWPGVNAAKIVLVTILFLPLIIIVSTIKSRINENAVWELCYWLLMSMLMVIGLCLVSFVDPRHYRYGIAIFGFTAVLSIEFILRYVFGFKKRFFAGALLLIFALSGHKIILSEGGDFIRPTFRDNVNVIFNKIQFDDVKDRYYSGNRIVDQYYDLRNEKIIKGAWDTGVGGMTNLSAFLLPIRPQVGLWHTTVVKWDSYKHEKLIVRDLKESDIEWIIRVREGRLDFLSAQEYSKIASKYNLHPEKIHYDYGFPSEITTVYY